jgi:hypothetical protein
MSLDSKVDSKTTIEGTARNAAGGAMVMSDQTPVYIDGLEAWDAGANGKHVSVSGTLRKRGPDQTVNDKGEYSSGFTSSRFVLESATWKVG